MLNYFGLPTPSCKPREMANTGWTSVQWRAQPLSRALEFWKLRFSKVKDKVDEASKIAQQAISVMEKAEEVLGGGWTSFQRHVVPSDYRGLLFRSWGHVLSFYSNVEFSNLDIIFYKSHPSVLEYKVNHFSICHPYWFQYDCRLKDILLWRPVILTMKYTTLEGNPTTVSKCKT